MWLEGSWIGTHHTKKHRLKHTLSLISIPTMSLSGYSGDRRTSRPPNPQPTSAMRTCKSDWLLSAACSCCCCLRVCGSSSVLACACSEPASCAGGVGCADLIAEVAGAAGSSAAASAVKEEGWAASAVEEEGWAAAAVEEEGWAASAGSEASVGRWSLSSVAVPLAAWKNSWK